MKKFAAFLLMRFIEGKDLNLPSERLRVGTIEGWVSIFGNLFLAIIKFISGFLTGSVSLMADAVHTASDVSSSAVILIGFSVSKKAPDKEHPFGHGRAEYISGMIIALMLVGAGIAFIFTSYERLSGGFVMQPSLPAIIVVVFSILSKEFLYHFSYQAGKTIDSEALVADALHHRTDSLTSAAVLIALIGAYFNLGFLDSVFGFIVSIFIIYSGVDIGKKSINRLLGTAPCEETKDNIFNSVLSIKGVMNAHDLDVHDYGARKSITIHIEVDGELNVHEAHDIAERVERFLRQKNRCHAVVHLDPHDDCGENN